MRNGIATHTKRAEDAVPIDELPPWARKQLGKAAEFLFPEEHDLGVETLIEYFRFLEGELTALSDRLAYGGAIAEGEDDSDGLPYTPFPLEVLPSALQDYVRASARAIPCAPAMVAVPMLAVLSGAVGTAARLSIKRSWHEVPILWTAVVAPSGSTKSPAADFALRPVYRREQYEAECYELALAEYEAALEAGETAEARPVRLRCRIGDVTREAVSKVLSENPRGVLLARDELATWLGSFDRYASGAADLHAWLAFYEGRQETVDRASGENVLLASPAVAVTGTIQPGTLKAKLTPLHFETGFAARLALCMPPASPRSWTDHDVTREVEDGYEAVLDQLYAIPMGTRLKMSSEAKQYWIDWYNAANRVAFEMPEGPGRAVVSKAVGQAARLALLLHLAALAERNGGNEGCWEEPVGIEALRRGTHLAAWLRDETLRVYQVLSLVDNAVPPIMRFLNALPEEFKTTQMEEVADELQIPRRTSFKWLKKLQEQGKLQKLKRGLYRKC